jgi:hypothetical protein
MLGFHGSELGFFYDRSLNNIMITLYLSMSRVCPSCLLENGSAGVLINAACTAAMTLEIPAVCIEEAVY